MGQVRFVQRAAVEQQLAAGNMVLLTNIGVSSSGELLNCNAFDVSHAQGCSCCLSLSCWLQPHACVPATWSAEASTPPACFPHRPLHVCMLQVATHAAVELRADKLLVITGQDVRQLGLPHYLPLVGPACF